DQVFEHIKDMERRQRDVVATLIRLLEIDVNESIDFSISSMVFYFAILAQGDKFLELEDNNGLHELTSQVFIENLFSKSLNNRRFIKYAFELIEDVQSRYRFYNYEVFQG
ncbi:MAG: hypothetical protein AAF329_25505, partial [Cyanobacteria bacterium P01_A01_bin.17]